MPKLSAHSQKALDDFDKAAQDWGWESDQGVTEVEAARDRYELTRGRLVERLLLLEEQRRLLIQQHRQTRGKR